MSWLIYTLLGVVIIVLLVYIIWSVMQTQPVKEGLVDYFTVEQYLQTLPTTQGRYVRIRPSGLSGDGRLTISQIQVLDMNGTNIALKMPVAATSTYAGAANVNVTVDGNINARTGFANVWTSSSADTLREFWVVDLGTTQQINQVVYTGQTATLIGSTTLPISILRTKGMICEILDTSYAVVATKTFPLLSVSQTLTFPNSINITPVPTGELAGALNPLLIPLNSAQPEVYSVSGSYTQEEADVTCGVLGAVVATSGQVNAALSNGASWCSAGWTYSPQLALSNPGCPSGLNTPSFTSSTQAAVNCFGIKPERSVNSTLSPFNANTWSQYVSNTAPTYYGATTITVPDVQKLYDYVSTTLLPTTLTSINTSITQQIPSLPAAPCKSTGQCGMKYTMIIPISSGYSVTDLDTAVSNTLNPNGCLTGDPKCSVSSPPDSLISKFGSYSNSSLYSALSTGPLNLLYDDGRTPAAQITALSSTLQVFGSVSAAAISDMNASMRLCTLIFLGSDVDVANYINVKLTDFKPYMRANTGYTNFCKNDILQTVVNGDFAFNVSAANQTSNQSVCNTPFTTDMLGLLPSPAANYLQTWIYNRVKRLIQYRKSSSTLSQADLNALGMPTLTPTTDLTVIMNSVQKMVPTVNGAPIPIDVTNNYVLDQIAQAFYETMGGNYIMSQIYDAYTIGGTIMDIRFDMTKHADISTIQSQIAALKNKYYSIRVSNVSQDILDSAKYEYETALQTLQEKQSTNILQPVVGVVGRFFYTYSTATQNFQITGFCLDSRSVTCFAQELNCGIQVSTGGAPGALNYVPTITYTKNVPDALPCRDPTTLRRIMEDYVALSQTDLQSVLLGGPASTPSMDTRLGTIHVNQILGAIQISPTQCAIKWTETLWDDMSNVPISTALTNVTRRALFSYGVDTMNWYGNTSIIDPSGTVFYPTDTVPACTFDPIAWQNTASPRLDSLNPVTNLAQIQSDFLANGWNNGFGLLCPLQIPNYIFSAQDYCTANPTMNTQFNGGGQGPLNSAGAKTDYMTAGLTARRPVRASQTITALTSPVVIQQPLPANNVLDTLNGVCPATTCEDMTVLFSLVDQYNKDPSQPGTILRVTRAYTASPYQCDVEVDINYDANAENGAGRTVKKGTFTYDSNGNEIPCTNCPPTTGQQVYSGTSIALFVGTNVADCSFSLLDSGARGSGTTIQSNTPPLYKPMEYATHLQSVNTPAITGTISAITAAVADAAINATSVLSTYRQNTLTVQASIATLGVGCPAKCSDTAILNNMIAYYKSQANRLKQINTVLRVGTLNSNSCDMTYREDTMIPVSGTTTYAIASSKTAGMRFTLTPDVTPCTFKTTAMTPILPTPPPITDMAQTPSSVVCNEVYGINNTTLDRDGAVAKCASYGAVLATKAQLTAATGATWSNPGYVVDVSGFLFNPTGTGLATMDTLYYPYGGAVCYGVKPTSGQAADVLPFAGAQWNQPGACTANINYVNPLKEGFTSEAPVHVSESTFPLTQSSFGLDIARNSGGPPLDSLFEEPLRQGESELDQPLLRPEKAKSYKYIRFRPIKTRDPWNQTVDVGKFRFLLGPAEVDLRFAKASNPMGSWVGDIQDVVGEGYRRGWSDLNKKAIVFAFPYAVLLDGFTWTTANPDRGVGGDPVQWKLEGSQNGTYWTVLRDQTRHNYLVPVARFQELPVFRF